MILKEMTQNKYNNLLARTEAWLATDIKEYRSGIALLNEWIHEDANVRMIRNGDPKRFIGILTTMLTKLKAITNYPRLIDSKEKAEKMYIATLPTPKGKGIPGEPEQPPIAPPATPASWDRYADFDSYKDRLSPELRETGEKQIPDMFLNLRRLHETVKRYDREKVQGELMEEALKELDEQNSAIQAYYDSLEAFFNGGDKTDDDASINTDDQKPSGRFTKEEIDRMDDPIFATESKMLRIEANKKYLKRKDIRNQTELDLRRKELEEWGVQIDN